MGMAASQARFLGLTARKTNTEYEGQQINQQRAILSNQSANYYNDLLGMTVPVPPAVSDYTKTVYTFNDGSLTNSISSMIAKQNGLYEISYTSSWTNDFAVTSSTPILYTRTTNEKATTSDQFENKYMVGAKRLRQLGTINTNADGTYAGTTIVDGTATYKYYDEYLSTLSAKQLANLINEEKEYINQLNEKYGIAITQSSVPVSSTSSSTTTTTSTTTTDNSTTTTTTIITTTTTGEDGEGTGTSTSTNSSSSNNTAWLVRYVQNTSTGTWSPYFVNSNILESENMVYDDITGSSQSTIKTYQVGSAKETEEIKGVPARMETDATGRIISVTLKPGEVDQVTYQVETTTVTDQAKYDDAMNQYEYDKAQYQQAVQEINAKIEIVQAEDKNLELRLKQLDTEQEAIQTEMDAVQKVIEKNTESTFKTFG